MWVGISLPSLTHEQLDPHDLRASDWNSSLRNSLIRCLAGVPFTVAPNWCEEASLNSTSRDSSLFNFYFCILCGISQTLIAFSIYADVRFTRIRALWGQRLVWSVWRFSSRIRLRYQWIRERKKETRKEIWKEGQNADRKRKGRDGKGRSDGWREELSKGEGEKERGRANHFYMGLST